MNWFTRLLQYFHIISQDTPASQPSLIPPPATVPTRKNLADSVLVETEASRSRINNILPTTASAADKIEQIQRKIQKLAEQFAGGLINRKQFEELFTHYQGQIMTLQMTLSSDMDPDTWKNLMAEGKSIMIRRKNEAKLIGFSIYDNQSGMPIKTDGEFGVDPALFVPMLASYQSASQEIFGAGLKSTEIEGGRWLCFIPGNITTTLALFSKEPAGVQLKTMKELQSVFESANKAQLGKPVIDPDLMVCPQQFFLQHRI